MKLKKVMAAITTFALTFGMYTSIPKVVQSSTFDSINKISSQFKIEPFSASAASSLRRPCSSETPMWIIHIDSWNYADPAKIIDLIPEDVLPYCVFNISLSINWDNTNHQWLMIQDGYECAKSWIKTCADKGVWTMIQPASGGQCHFPDYDSNGNIINFPNKGQFVANDGNDLENSVFAEFFRDYPNFIGYNYCEQFWGFASQDFPITYQQRYQHFAKLLELCNKYGGYLNISVCENQWGTALNPIGLLKQVPEWNQACCKYSENLILEEKYTQHSYIADIESEVYGAYIAGYCGNYGVRWDDTGWSDDPWSENPTKNQYRVSTSLPIFFERMVQNGMTVIDGPELVWAEDFKETWGTTDSEGYHERGWEMYDQYQNDIIDIFRKVQDKTIRIPDRKEVIDRTKVVVIQDMNSGNDENKYSTYPTLFEGLYKISDDGNLRDNRNPFKSTGRYQTIPTIAGFADDLAKSIPVQVKQSEIDSRWPTIKAKQDEFNKLYASDYWGNCYVGRNENTWTAYNPNKKGDPAGGVLSLKYNTCKNVDLSFTAYGSAVMNEYSDHIDFYLNNYDEDAKTTLKTTTIKIAGCKSEPKITYQKDRGVNQAKTSISTSYSNDTYTITVNHNGPLDLSVSCSGNETNRQTSYKTANLVEPDFPDFYEGERQYEGEFFDTKNVEGNVTNGCKSGITGYWGQGFMKFGTKANAAVKDTVTTKKAGTFDMNLRYSATSDIKNIDLYVNGSKVKTLSLPKGSSLSDWKMVTEKIALKEGDNKIELKANAALSSTIYLDCFTVNGDFGDASGPKTLNGTLIKNLAVNDTKNASNWSIDDSGSFGTGSSLFGDRDITATSVPKNLIGAEIINTACDSKMYTNDLGTFTAGADITVYTAIDSRVVPILPEWLGNWEKTDETITSTGNLTFEVYKKNFNSGETVTLGKNGGTGDNTNYFVLAKHKEIILNGNLIKNLQVYDTENGSDWSIYNNTGSGSLMFGDRDITAVNFPANLVGAETIKTACDSKMYTNDLGTFTAGADITVYIAMDTRVVSLLPEWLESWNKTDINMTSNNNLTFEFYKKDFKSGETVTLGMNGGNGNCVNYTVYVTEQISAAKGDVNLDGCINIFDLGLAKQGFKYGFDNDSSKYAADIDNNGKVEISDITQLQKYILGVIKNFNA